MFWKVTAIVDGETLKAQTNALDVMAWESETGKSLTDEGSSFTSVFDISYRAFVRLGKTELDRDSFASGMSDIKTRNVSANPTRKARSEKP